MNRTYVEEMAALPETWRRWDGWRREVDPDDAIGEAAGPAAFVASGGSLAVAHLGAATFERRRREPGTVLTPVEFATSPMTYRTVVVVSDSMGHPDALLAADLAATGCGCGIVLTNRDADELRSRVDGRTRIVSCPRPGRDGWIATNSVLSLSLGVLTVLGVGSDAPQPEDVMRRWTVHGRLRTDLDTTRPRILCLYTPGLRSAAVDLETRTAESGLGAVTITDIRNLGHGRHVGLYRHADTTCVLILAGPGWERMARGTVESLPPNVESRIWQVEGDPEWAPVELLVPSAAFLAARAAEAGVDPGNPTVWSGGGNLFRAPVVDLLPAGPR